MQILFALILALPFLLNAATSNAQVAASTIDDHLLVIYDSSNSMWGELGDRSRKYEAGRNALSAFLASDIGDRQLGFRAYGHRYESDCTDTELVVPFTDVDSARAEIQGSVEAIRPTGKTPITLSLRESLKDFAGSSGDILLISDGLETCDIDPCDLMREWQAADINIRVHVVGVGLTDVERIAMSCIADTSGGQYFDADSADELAVALNEAGVAIDEPASGEAAPTGSERAYALKIVAKDDQGRTYVAKGKLFKDGEELAEVYSHYRNVLEAPGDYVIEVGPILKDDTIYKPVRQELVVENRGDTVVEVLVTRPAIVTAKFLENGEDHRGSYVTAYFDGEEVFGFRGSDEALARPGSYEFRATPNDDNELALTESLIEGEHAELLFELTKTVNFYVRYVLPDGETFRRGSELWHNGQKVYGVYSGNPTTVRPGVYQLRAEDQNLPLTPVDIEIKTDGETIMVPIDAGWVQIGYAASDFDYVSEPDRAWLESLDRGGSKYARINTPIAVKPGRYRANPHTARGFFDPIDFEVESNKTVKVEFDPKPLGEIVVNYAPSDNWPTVPDRAIVRALEDQKIIGGSVRPGIGKKLLPGRYLVRGGGSSNAAIDQEVVVRPHETLTVTLKHKLD